MSLIFVDGFSHYNQALMGDKWDVVQHGSLDVTMTQSASANGRFGGGGAAFTDADGGAADYTQYMQKNFNGVGTIYCGFAIQQTGTQNVFQSPGGGRLITFLDGNTVQCAITLLQSGQLQAIRNTVAGGGYNFLTDTTFGGTTLGTSTDAIASSSFDFLEFKIVCNAATGSVTVKRNGSTFWTLSNVNTNVAGTGSISSIIIGGYHVTIGGNQRKFGLQANICDVYILNTTVNGSDPNDPIDFIGDRHWETVLPSADSTPLDWTITGSADHFANVDDVPPNTTDYNSTDTVTDEDALIFNTLTGPTTASVLLSYTMYVQKNTGGAVGISGLMVSPAGGGGTHGNGTEFQAPNPWGFRQSFLCTDPAAPGTDPLTVATVNAGAHGYERTS